MKQVNLGVIGLGYQGKIHLQNALYLKETKVLGAADVSEKALTYAKNLGVKNVYKDYESLLKNPQLDAVIISLPNFLHLEGAVKAAEAGKHIFIEKPLARNVVEGEKILSSVKENGVSLMVGYDLRFNPDLKSVRERISDGFFGEVQIVEATNVSGGPFASRNDRVGPIPVPSWWFDKELAGGGALLDLGSHMIDLLSWYFGETEVIESYLGYTLNMKLEDVATCMLKFKNGPIATVKVGWFSKNHTQSIQICGTAQNLWMRISPQSSLGIIWNDVKRKFGLQNSSPYYLELEHFVSSLQKDKQPRPSGDDGLRCLRVISRAYEKTCKNLEKGVGAS
ncbi:Gfo/Idh/MocA family oxidoreductase [Candidatus Bathyarchaeota archaeon]|nr:Gfo/Idh/MocA family oxidoreductase [Candidatus Bathyarchaeota archaeon]